MRGAVALCNGRIFYDFQSLRLKAWPFDGFLKSVSSTLVFRLECNANHYSTNITKNKRLKNVFVLPGSPKTALASKERPQWPLKFPECRKFPFLIRSKAHNEPKAKIPCDGENPYGCTVIESYTLFVLYPLIFTHAKECLFVRIIGFL